MNISKLLKNYSRKSKKMEEEIKSLQGRLDQEKDGIVDNVVRHYTDDHNQYISFTKLKDHLDDNLIELIAIEIMEQRTLLPEEVDDTLLSLLLNKNEDGLDVALNHFKKTFDCLNNKGKLRVSLFRNKNQTLGIACNYMRDFLLSNYCVTSRLDGSTDNQLLIDDSFGTFNQPVMWVRTNRTTQDNLPMLATRICLLLQVYKIPFMLVDTALDGVVRSVKLELRDYDSRRTLRHPVVSVNDQVLYESTGITYEEKVLDALRYINNRFPTFIYRTAS